MTSVVKLEPITISKVGGKVLVLSTFTVVEEQITEAMGKEEAHFEGYSKVVGMDLKYNRSSSVGIQLGMVQLAFEDVTIIIQMVLLGGKYDTCLLLVALGTPVNGCIELSVLTWMLPHKSLKWVAATLPGCVSLGDLCEAYTEIRLCKDKGKAILDWSVEVLGNALVHCEYLDGQ
ncbi:hypothetical protein PILCRDRAFT_85673 [Piloderma croceum F 1598]|uniref:Uncharacterized protein n=1 Tax=Piloderma croceum (strain F 1598) TaxID=765440 RepID=A0A0C3G7U1_PILCF|nr:hypothetical protein PILCRDRAFT_85673 [Piloderma croceum F 1598]